MQKKELVEEIGKLNVKIATSNKELEKLELEYKKKRLELKKYKNETKSYLVKRQSLENDIELIYKKGIEIINYSKIICIFGMSLGKTDKDWYKLIKHRLLADSDSRLIIFWYISNADRTKIPKGAKKAREIFYRHSECYSRSEKLKIQNRIHVIVTSKENNVFNTIIKKSDSPPTP